MPEYRRAKTPGASYFFTVVTFERRSLLTTDFARQCLRSAWQSTRQKYPFDEDAVVLMPDHLHWLLIPKAGALNIAMQRTKSRSAISVNRALGRRGQVWQKGYHDRALRREEDLLSAARYIVANPLRAGIANSLAEYPHWDATWL